MTPERLAEILEDIYNKNMSLISCGISIAMTTYAAELFKVVEVKEKE